MTLPAEFWPSEKRQLLSIFIPALEKSALLGAINAALKLRGIEIVFDALLVNAAASQWARNHADVIAGWVGTNNEKTAHAIIANWIETPGSTQGDLVAALKPAFDGNTARADLIAITETTRAFAQGESLVYAEAGIGQLLYVPPAHPGCRCWTAVERRNGQNVVVWKTNHDDVTCRQKLTTPWGVVDGCRALHNKVISNQ